MTDDFAPIERIAGAALRALEPGERRALLRRMAREIQRSQSARIARQEDPSGSRFAKRQAKSELKPGAYAVKFLYPKGVAEPRLVHMKSWVKQGELMTGYDLVAGGIRSFFWDKVAKWLPVDPGEKNAGAGKLRRRRRIKDAAMFRKLRQGRFLRTGGNDREAWIGFTGRAAEIARVSQDGLMDRPTAKAKPVRYAQRGLLGLTAGERNRALDLLLEHISPAL